MTDEQHEALAGRVERLEQILMIAGLMERPVAPPKPTPTVVPISVRYGKEMERDRAYFIYDCRCGHQHDHDLLVAPNFDGKTTVRCPESAGSGRFDVLIEFNPTYSPAPRSTYV
jgi:hypothetical protein